MGHSLLDHPVGMVRTSFSTANAGDGNRSKLGDNGFSRADQAEQGGQNSLIQFLEDLPQSRLFTLLAAVGVLFVIAKRRLAAEHG